MKRCYSMVYLAIQSATLIICFIIIIPQPPEGGYSHYHSHYHLFLYATSFSVALEHAT